MDLGGAPSVAEEEEEEVGKGVEKSTVESAVPKVPSRSTAGEARNEAPRISTRESAKTPSSALL